MLRIRLATGEEAVYRTVEELALGISSGIITGAALVFDARAGEWRSVRGHPEYHQAMARAGALSLTAEFDSGLAVRHTTGRPSADRVSGSRQIYQMVSRSAAELEARRWTAWVIPTATAVAGLLMVVSLALTLRADRNTPLRTEAVRSPSTTARPVATSPRLPSTSSVEAMRLAPVNLNSHLAFAMEAAGRRLADTASELGFHALLSENRLLSPDSVHRTRDLLASLRNLVAAYRGAQRQIALAYRDTAALLTNSGFWSRVDAQEWRVYPQSSETPREAAKADTLLGALERLYDLLEAEAGAYRDVDGRLQFDNPAAGAQYERLHAILTRHESAHDTAGIKPTGALALLRRAVSAPAPTPGRASPASP
jgi:hypothetical protein